jgi:non-heme chloroperoxidase
MKIHTIRGATGVNLHVREYGKSNGIPILLIHGWSQNHLCWSKQYDSALKDDARIVALDLRGHGMSDAPMQADQYTDGDKWADDIAVISSQSGSWASATGAWNVLMVPPRRGQADCPAMLELDKK